MNKIINMLYFAGLTLVASCTEEPRREDVVSLSDSYKLTSKDLKILKDSAVGGNTAAEKRVYLFYAIYLQDPKLADQWRNEVLEKKLKRRP